MGGEANGKPGRTAKVVGATVENVHAPELYAVKAGHFSIIANVVTVTLVAPRWDMSTEPPTLRPVVVGRLSMPTEGAQGLAAGLANFLCQPVPSPARQGEAPRPN